MTESRCEFELVDGLWPVDGTYISVTVPPNWLTDEAELEDDGNAIYIDFAELVETRLANGMDDFSQPSKQAAARTISALRRYADELERHFVNGELSYDEAVAKLELEGLK